MSVLRVFDLSLFSLCRCNMGWWEPLGRGRCCPSTILGFIKTLGFVSGGDPVTAFPLSPGITWRTAQTCVMLLQIQQMADSAAAEMDKLLAAKTKELLG